MNETQAILAVNPMIASICKRFAYKFWLDAEEVMQEMQIVALKAIRKYDPTRGSLENYVRRAVINSLYRRIDHHKFRERFCKSPIMPDVKRHVSDFDLAVFIMELSDDAARAVELAIDENEPDRIYIESILYSSFGWTQSRITKVFSEIRDALP